MRSNTGKNKSGRPVFSPSRARSRKTPELYRPSGSFPFPEACGKTVADVYVTIENDRSCVTLRFDDNIELVVNIEPRLSFTAGYSEWKTGNERVIKRWPRVCSTELPRVMKCSANLRKEGKRPLGFLRGTIWMAPDFDVPMKLVDDVERIGSVPENTNSPTQTAKAPKSARIVTRRQK